MREQFRDEPTRVIPVESMIELVLAEDVDLGEWDDGPTSDWPLEETMVEVIEDITEELPLLQTTADDAWPEDPHEDGTVPTPISEQETQPQCQRCGRHVDECVCDEGPITREESEHGNE